ncbi:hypothetical protein [Legionella sp. km772]|uniref:hypothetical protein n=1 Tax=Legionella sp. km772 TaxID=2498111 RepID=UPI000F8CC291|nr:hypothetical protein [Legionella sp. km772]RUR12797.1 hypothetical protein ELY15_03945 [Legionella sp. km772]
MGHNASKFFSEPRSTAATQASSGTADSTMDIAESAPETGTEALRNIATYDLRLKNALKGSLLPMHTHFFVKNDANKSFVHALLEDNQAAFSNLTRNLDSDNDKHYEILKECLILAALLGSKKVLSKLKEFNITMDSEVLNMALWSGDFEGPELNYFLAEVAPTYNSIRHAILSANPQVLAQVFQAKPSLKANSELLGAVSGSAMSAADKTRMVELLQAHGLSTSSSQEKSALEHIEHEAEHKSSPFSLGR